jgi:hypothetical protein
MENARGVDHSGLLAVRLRRPTSAALVIHFIARSLLTRRERGAVHMTHEKR